MKRCRRTLWFGSPRLQAWEEVTGYFESSYIKDIIEYVDLNMHRVYMTNLYKCPDPPKNEAKKVKPEDKRHCFKAYTQREIEIINPKLIITCHTEAKRAIKKYGYANMIYLRHPRSRGKYRVEWKNREGDWQRNEEYINEKEKEGDGGKEKGDGEEKERKAFDISGGFFKENDLTDDQRTLCLKQGFVFSRQSKGIGRGERYLLKPDRNEGPKHFFVRKLVESEVKKYTDRVEAHVAHDPDVVFESWDGRVVAVEVETGHAMQKRWRELTEKVHGLKKYDDWFFVVTDSKMKRKYEQVGATITRNQIGDKIKEYFPNEVDVSDEDGDDS